MSCIHHDHLPGCTGSDEFKTLEADNARLRALIKGAEWGDGTQGGRWCPWCQSKEERGHYAKTQDCATDCPAFTPEGAVK